MPLPRRGTKNGICLPRWDGTSDCRGVTHLDGGAPGRSNALLRQYHQQNRLSPTGSAQRTEGRRASGGSLGCIGIRHRIDERIELQGERQTGRLAREWQAREASSAAVLAQIHDRSGTRVADTSRKVLAGQLCLAARPRLQELPVQIRQNGIILRKLDRRDTSNEAMLPSTRCL